MKNIGFLIYTMKGGGAERVVSNLVNELSGEFNTYLLLFDAKDAKYNIDIEVINIGPFDKCGDSISIKKMDVILYNPLELIKIYLNLWKTVKQKKLDVMISFLPGPNLINASLIGKHKKILSVRSYMQGTKPGLVNKTKIALSHRYSGRTVAVSEMIKSDLIQNFGVDGKRISVIYNPVRLDIINKMSEEVIPEEFESIFDGPTIISVGRLERIKGHTELIFAFNQVKQNINTARLLIIGEGPLEEDLKRLVSELGLADVHFLGYQSNPFKFVSRSSVFVLSSHNEGFPNSLVEAMACGIPVISTDCKTGPREILIADDRDYYGTTEVTFADYGTLVPSWDFLNDESVNKDISKVEFLEKAIIEILSDADLSDHYSRQSRKRAQDFEMNVIIDQWKNVIMDLS